MDDANEARKLLIVIRLDLYLRLKMESAISKISMKIVIEKLIEDHIEKR